MKNSFIIGAKRTAVTPRDGALASLELHQLGAPVIKSLLASCHIDAAQIDELIVGNALGAGGNPARVIALASGLPERVAGLSIDRQCCSGLDAIQIAHDMVVSGRASIVIAGGAESYSNRPKRLRKTNEQWLEYDQPAFTPWPDRDPDMAMAADALAQKIGISFEQQNQWAVHSHQKALDAADRLQHEMISLNGCHNDSYARQLNLQICQRAKRIHGSVSVANTAAAADGAAFCLVANEDFAKKLNRHYLRICSGVTIGTNPELPGLAPVSAIRSVLKAEHLSAKQLHRAEIMEAYAAQAIACIEQSGLDASICNVGGGSLARGHPIGASGAILITRLFSELENSGGYGLAAIAAAGGLGSALLLEAV